MQSGQVALQSFCQKVTKIKLGHQFKYKKPLITPNSGGGSCSKLGAQIAHETLKNGCAKSVI